MEPKVSVIIPTYKRGDIFLKRAIDSVLKQTYPNIEIIIIDDNANELLHDYRVSTKKVVKAYKDPNIIYMQNAENLGGSLSRNEGIKFSSGEFITFLDDDDEYLPEKISNQIEKMIKNEWDVSFTDLKICNEQGKTIDYRDYKKIKSFNKVDLIEYHLTRHITGTPTFMYKKEILQSIGGFPDVKMGQEFYLMFNTIEADVNIGYIPSSGVIAYRHSSGGISMGVNKIIGEKDLYTFKRSYFKRLSLRKRLFIKFRHHVVLAIAYKRNKMLFSSIKNIGLAFLYSPLDSLIEFYCLTYKIVSKR
ncbi:glycosyltransferase family 2 protein [Peribacillus butanolivorans]|uniref:glycosyltransferase family 2 protein n=1 Tax=Peribacillus butanolivorans TaxID=421767 RepID=UPI0036C190ED